MSATFLTSLLVSAALLVGKPKEPPKPAAEPAPQPAKLVQVTYPIAELVIPIGDKAYGFGEALEKPQQRLEATSSSTPAQPQQTLADQLLNLITSTIARESWATMGGKGTIAYYPIGHGLEVKQTQEVQEEIADLLAALRRLQDLEVAVEIRLVSVSESVLEHPGAEVGLPCATTAVGGTESTAAGLPSRKEMTFLNDKQVLQLLGAAGDDQRTSTMQAPRMTMFNGQKTTLHLTEVHRFVTDLKVVRDGDQAIVLPKNEAFTTGIQFSVQPVVSADRRFVRLHFTGRLTELETPALPLVPVTTHLVAKVDQQGEEHVVPVQQFVQQPSFRTMTFDKAFQVADGQTAVFRWGTRDVESRAEIGPPVLSKIPYVSRLFTNVGYGRETQTLLLLITPRIIVNEEEEHIYLGNLPPLPRP
jgi:general secretion pathway protein D